MSIAQKVVSAMAWDFLGKASLTLIRFAESIILVHLLGNQHYGILATLINFQGIAVLLAALGLEGMLSKFIPHIQVKGKESNVAQVLRSVLKLRLLFLMLVASVCFIAAPEIASLQFDQVGISEELLIYYVQLLSLLIISVSLQDLFRRVLVIYYQQRFINLIELVGFSLYLGLAVLSIYLGLGIQGVLLANILSKVLGLLFFIRKSQGYFIEGLPSLDQGKKCEQVSEFQVDRSHMKQYAKHFYIYALMLYVLGKGADILIIASWMPEPREVAFYTIAYNLAFFASSFMELALQGGFVLPLISETFQKQQFEKLKLIYKGLFEFIYLFTLPISIGGILLSEELIDCLYGEVNLSAAPLFACLMGHFMVVKIGILNANFMLAMEQERKLIYSRGVFGIFNVVLNLILVQTHGTLGVVWGTLATGILSSIYESWLVHRSIHPSYPVIFFVKILTASCLMGIAVIAVKTTIEGWGSLGILIVSISIGGIVYLGLLAQWKPVSPEISDILKHTKLPFKEKVLRVLVK